MESGSIEAVDPIVWRATQEIACAVSDASGVDELGQLVMNALNRMVGCDLGSILTATPGHEWSIAGEIGDNRKLGQNYWRYAGEMSNGELQRLAGNFSLATEVFQPLRRERLGVFREFLNPNGLSEVAVANWVVDARICVIGLARSKASFDDRDLARLTAIVPVLRAALRAARWLAGDDGDTYPCAGFGGPWSLTPAQERTMSLVLRGLTNKEVADLLGTSPNTVRNTLAEVFKKVGVSRRSELAFIVRVAATDPDPRRAEHELRDHRRLMETIATEPRALARVAGT